MEDGSGTTPAQDMYLRPSPSLTHCIRSSHHQCGLSVQAHGLRSQRREVLRPLYMALNRELGPMGQVPRGKVRVHGGRNWGNGRGQGDHLPRDRCRPLAYRMVKTQEMLLPRRRHVPRLSTHILLNHVEHSMHRDVVSPQH